MEFVNEMIDDPLMCISIEANDTKGIVKVVKNKLTQCLN